MVPEMGREVLMDLEPSGRGEGSMEQVEVTNQHPYRLRLPLKVQLDLVTSLHTPGLETRRLLDNTQLLHLPCPMFGVLEHPGRVLKTDIVVDSLRPNTHTNLLACR